MINNHYSVLLVNTASLSSPIRSGMSYDAIQWSHIQDFLDVECSSMKNDDGDRDGDDVSSASETPPASTVDASVMASKVRTAARRLRALLDRGGMVDDPFRFTLAGDVARAAEEMAALRGARPAFRRLASGRPATTQACAGQGGARRATWPRGTTSTSMWW